MLTASWYKHTVLQSRLQGSHEPLARPQMKLQREPLARPQSAPQEGTIAILCQEGYQRGINRVLFNTFLLIEIHFQLIYVVFAIIYIYMLLEVEIICVATIVWCFCCCLIFWVSPNIPGLCTVFFAISNIYIYLYTCVYRYIYICTPLAIPYWPHTITTHLSRDCWRRKVPCRQAQPHGNKTVRKKTIYIYIDIKIYIYIY